MPARCAARRMAGSSGSSSLCLTSGSAALSEAAEVIATSRMLRTHRTADAAALAPPDALAATPPAA